MTIAVQADGPMQVKHFAMQFGHRCAPRVSCVRVVVHVQWNDRISAVGCGEPVAHEDA